MLSSLIKRVSLFVILASGIGCRTAPVVETPAQMSFRPTRHGAEQWLATPFAEGRHGISPRTPPAWG